MPLLRRKVGPNGVGESCARASVCVTLRRVVGGGNGDFSGYTCSTCWRQRLCPSSNAEWSRWSRSDCLSPSPSLEECPWIRLTCNYSDKKIRCASYSSISFCCSFLESPTSCETDQHEKDTSFSIAFHGQIPLAFSLLFFFFFILAMLIVQSSHPLQTCKSKPRLSSTPTEIMKLRVFLAQNKWNPFPFPSILPTLHLPMLLPISWPIHNYSGTTQSTQKRNLHLLPPRRLDIPIKSSAPRSSIGQRCSVNLLRNRL